MPSGGAASGCPHWAQVGGVIYSTASQQGWHTQGSEAPRVLRLHTRQRGGKIKSSSTRTAPYAPAMDLTIQPQRCSATAIVEGEVGGIVLHIRLPGASEHARS